MTIKRNHALALVLSGAVLIASLPSLLFVDSVAADSGVMRNLSTMEIVEDMGYGINLGNTFESTVDWDAGENWIEQYGDGTPNAYETAWGSPTVTEKMIQGYADEGFGVLRVPVAWSNMMAKDGSYTINAAYKARVRQVIDWALDADLYVIMNLHWDGGWLENLPNDHDNCMKKYKAIWTQLCDEFKSYGDTLIFESQNEELYWNTVWNQWSGSTSGKDKAYGYCNEVNQTFVDLVRASGGNNAKRHLLISGYNTAVDLTCDPLFKMPKDSAGRCAVSVHYYNPSTFAILEEDASWGKCATTWGSTAEVAELNKNMDLLKTTFVDKGVPVIIGEYGCPTKNKDAASVRKYLSAICEQSLKRGGICPVLWDITGLHYNRGTGKLNDTALHDNFTAYGKAYTKQVTPSTTAAPTTTAKPATTTTTSVTAPPVVAADGLIENLTVFDKTNAAAWSVTSGARVGETLFGDRDFTISAMPTNLTGAQMIRTACDSKVKTTDLGKFTAGKNATVYAAVDSRVTAKLPDWLKAWTYTGCAVTTSNALTLTLYKLDVKAGEVVALGTNGGSTESVNYVVMAVPQESVKKGDLNFDGAVNAFDLMLAKTGFMNGFSDTRLFDAADVDGDEALEQDDLQQLQGLLIQKRDGFTSSAKNKPAPAVPVEPTEPVSTFNYNANLAYHAPPAAYKTDCSRQGKIESLAYKTSVYTNQLTKTAYVYLPYGYDASKQYNILYLMHGGGGNEKSIFVENKVLQRYLDHMIANGDIEPMIVVTPTVNNAAGSDATANNKNFWNELKQDVVPAIEGKYSTYAASTSASDLKASRSHRAFAGFSMGSLCTWGVLLHDLDYFRYIMPLSGDCWEGSTADEKATAIETAIAKQGYGKNDFELLCMTGSKDIAYSAMNAQVEAMKKKTGTFAYTSDFSKGNFYFMVCEGGTHWWDGYICDYIYDGLPYFFHES